VRENRIQTLQWKSRSLCFVACVHIYKSTRKCIKCDIIDCVNWQLMIIGNNNIHIYSFLSFLLIPHALGIKHHTNTR
jgi:hypothetical protein